MSAPRRTVVALRWWIAAVLLFAALPAGAQEKKIDELIRLLATQPEGMDEITWKERRREAARELGNLGDARAVPALIEVVETEEFDVVGERAIVALGKLRDPRAVPVLQKVLGSPDRDRDQKRAARQALKRLGASPTAAVPAPDRNDAEPPVAGTGDLAIGGGSPLVVGGSGGEEAVPVSPPSFEEDTLAAAEVIRLAIGGLSLQYDTVRKRPTATGDVSAGYEKRVDRKSWAWRYGADADATLGFVNFEGGDSSSRSGTFNARLFGEGRGYLADAPLYAGALGTLGGSVTGLRIYQPDGDSIYELNPGFDVSAGVVVGYGRVLDVGEAIRLRRIEQVLRETRTLGRSIQPELAERILAAWWALRGELGAHRRLVVTVRLLREAGVLLGEPSASVSYKILQVLLDGQLTHRLRGLDIQVGVVEGFVVRDDFLGVDDGRAETVLSRARYGLQGKSGTSEIVGEATARYRILAGDDDPSPWAASASAAVRKYFYGPNWDPIGALEFSGQVGAANDDVTDSTSTGARVAAAVGWRWVFNRVSNLRLAGQAMFESGELFVGLTLDGSYGFLDVGYVGGAALPASLQQ